MLSIKITDTFAGMEGYMTLTQENYLLLQNKLKKLGEVEIVKVYAEPQTVEAHKAVHDKEF